MRLLSILFFLLTQSASLFGAEVVFLRQYDVNGVPITLESGKAYAHAAIKKGDRWLHAIPYWGVILSERIEDYGEPLFTLVNSNIPEPGDDFLEKVLGKRYFLFSDWYNFDEFNCTKLIGLALNLDPHPLVIDENIWGDRFNMYLDRSGLTLGALEEQLLSKDFQETEFPLRNPTPADGHSCRNALL